MKKEKPHHPSTLARAALCRKIAAQHYEPGNYSRSYHAVWRHHIRPIYGCCYHTFLSYLHMPDLPDTRAKEDPRQLHLF